MRGFSTTSLTTVFSSLLAFQATCVSSLALPRHASSNARPRSASPHAGLTNTTSPLEPSVVPLGNRTDDPPSLWPTKYYNLTLTRGWVDSNGEPREAFLVNGQTPGPLLEAEEGQEISIYVQNSMGEKTTLHWHGLIQYGSVWADGVPGVTQYPIENGDSFTYTFTPVQNGQYWYHSHYRSQLSDGLRGPMVIHPAASRPSPFSLISSDNSDVKQMKAAERDPHIVFQSDWSQLNASEVDAAFRATGIEPLCVDSFLINGRGQRICPQLDLLTPFAPPIVQPLTDKGCAPITSPIVRGQFDPTAQFPDLVPAGLFSGCSNTSSPLSVFEVDQANGWASFNFIHGGGTLEQQVSIDGHKLVVYATDGQYVKPQWVDVILLSSGARYSAMVKLDNPGDWTIRTANWLPNQFINGYAVLSYTSAAKTVCGPPKDGLPALCGKKTFTSPPAANQASQGYAGNLLGSSTLYNAFTAEPFPALAVPQNVDHSIIWDMTKPTHRIWSIDDQPLLPWREDSTPAIVDPQPFLDANVATAFKNGSVIDIILNVPAGQPPHPFHKHENKAWVIGEGNGAFIWNTTAEAIAAVPGSFNLNTPSYRDTYRTLPATVNPTWQVIRYQVDHPSLTFFHCHISYHLASGMAIVLVEGLDVGRPEVPQQIFDGNHEVLTSNPDPVYPDGTVVEG